MFDSTAIVWYAAVCGALAAFAPRFGGRTVRIVTGAIVGILAASVFPMIRGMAGY